MADIGTARSDYGQVDGPLGNSVDHYDAVSRNDVPFA